ncbi:F-box only protein 6-like [Centroberyx affinis]|uniref:F-box only protein 6-like n=1 Tax=Centroberyx affinis TaxID=166261 RepID=UPI003A5BB4F2
MRKRAMGATHSAGTSDSDPNQSQSRNPTSSDTVDPLQPADSTGLFPALPLEVLEEIFMNVAPHQVVCVCRLVCREWKDLVDSESLWRERCRREGYHLRDATKTPSDWRLFYFLCKKRRNLLKNSRGQQILNGWQILENGGDKWKVEGAMVPHPDETVQKVFVTSYQMCRKSQLIDLVKEGYNPSFMDHFQPDIKISDWYAPRWDCGCEYEIRVELLNHKKKPVQTFAPETVYFEQWNDQQWNQVTHVFKDYGPGVRYIRFIHGGKDTQFWAGWYGVRVTDSCVEICPSVMGVESSCPLGGAGSAGEVRGHTPSGENSLKTQLHNTNF